MPKTDNKEKFVKDFVAVWTKVMNADRFDPQSYFLGFLCGAGRARTDDNHMVSG